MTVFATRRLAPDYAYRAASEASSGTARTPRSKQSRGWRQHPAAADDAGPSAVTDNPSLSCTRLPLIRLHVANEPRPVVGRNGEYVRRLVLGLVPRIRKHVSQPVRVARQFFIGTSLHMLERLQNYARIVVRNDVKMCVR